VAGSLRMRRGYAEDAAPQKSHLGRQTMHFLDPTALSTQRHVTVPAWVRSWRPPPRLPPGRCIWICTVLTQALLSTVRRVLLCAAGYSVLLIFNLDSVLY